MDFLIRANDLSKMIGGKTLFEGATFDVSRNDCIGLIGANGSGKTTLFKVILGREHISLGDLWLKEDIRIRYLEQVAVNNRNITVGEYFSRITSTNEGIDRIKEYERKLSDPETYSSGKYEEIMNEYEKLQTDVDWTMGDSRLETGLEILKEIGLGELSPGARLNNLSGGELQKLVLAGVFSFPKGCDLLLLDEPTNHLDIETIEWLEKKIADFPGAVIIVSHDRYLLDNLVDRMFEIEGGGIEVYNTTYEEYEEIKGFKQHIKQQEFKRSRIELKRQQRSIEKMSRRCKYDRQITSKLKQLEKVKRVENPIIKSYLLRFQFESVFKSSVNVADSRGVTKRFGDRIILDDARFEVSAGQRVGLIGPNGSGKTTFLKMLIGKERTDRGKIHLSKNVKWRYFDQGHLSLQPGNTLIEEVVRGKEGLRENDAKALLGQFNFNRDEINRKVKFASGGERARLALLRLLLKPCNLLILDEPTNHMDILSKKAIEGAINSFDGTVIVVSHDRNFLDNVCNMIFLISEGEIHSYNGNYSSFRGQHMRRYRNVSGVEPKKYLVRKTFTEWTTRVKYKRGDKIVVDEDNENIFRSALENGWLRELNK